MKCLNKSSEPSKSIVKRGDAYGLFNKHNEFIERKRFFELLALKL